MPPKSCFQVLKAHLRSLEDVYPYAKVHTSPTACCLEKKASETKTLKAPGGARADIKTPFAEVHHLRTAVDVARCGSEDSGFTYKALEVCHLSCWCWRVQIRGSHVGGSFLPG